MYIKENLEKLCNGSIMVKVPLTPELFKKIYKVRSFDITDLNKLTEIADDLGIKLVDLISKPPKEEPQQLSIFDELEENETKTEN